MEWVRLYHDMPADPKWRVIAKKADQKIGDVISVYVFLLCNASGNTVKRGVTQGFVSEDVAAALDLQESDVIAVLEAMEGKVLRNGALMGWEKRNPLREDSSTERVRKHRVTQRNAMKRPDTEEDTDKKISSLRSDSPPEQGGSIPKTSRKISLPVLFPAQGELEWACDYWRGKGRADLAERVADEVDQFRDHHAKNRTLAADWPATWRTWVRNALKFNRAPSQNQQPFQIIKVA